MTRNASDLLIQDVLKRRFRLTVRDESRALPVYDLVQMQRGIKLERAQDGSCFQAGAGKVPPRASAGKGPVRICGGFVRSSDGGVDASGITMSGFCKRLSYALDRDVVDKTGLAGNYNLHLQTTLDELPLFPSQHMSSTPLPDAVISEASEPSGSLFSAVRKIGLRLVPSTTSSKIVIIDKVELPEAN